MDKTMNRELSPAILQATAESYPLFSKVPISIVGKKVAAMAPKYISTVEYARMNPIWVWVNGKLHLFI